MVIFHSYVAVYQGVYVAMVIMVSLKVTFYHVGSKVRVGTCLKMSLGHVLKILTDCRNSPLFHRNVSESSS